MKKLFFIGACLLALGSTPAMAQTAQAVAVVEINFNGVPRPFAGIARGGVTPEYIRQEKGEDSAVFYQRIIAKLYQEGYALKSTMASNDLKESVLIFENRR